MGRLAKKAAKKGYKKYAKKVRKHSPAHAAKVADRASSAAGRSHTSKHAWGNVERAVKHAKKLISQRHRKRALAFLKEKKAKENANKHSTLPHAVYSVKRAAEVK